MDSDLGSLLPEGDFGSSEPFQVSSRPTLISSKSNSLAPIRRSVSRALSRSGLLLQRDALDCMVQKLKEMHSESREAWIAAVVAQMKISAPNLSKAISAEFVQAAFQEIEKNSAQEDQGEKAEYVQENIHKGETRYRIVNAFETPKFLYDVVRKSFFEVKSSEEGFFLPANGKPRVFRDRFNTVLQRLLRHELFTKPAVDFPGAEQEASHYAITPISSISAQNPRKLCCLFGMLVMIDRGYYAIEDMTGSIRINFEACQSTSGVFVPGCLVLIEGHHDPAMKEFRVTSMGFPPSEPRSETLHTFPKLQSRFSDNSDVFFSEKDKMESLMVIISEVYLDDTKCIEKAEKIFEGFASMDECDIPVLFVLLGNFTRNNEGNIQKFQAALSNLDKILRGYPSLHRSSFVLIPGPNDPGITSVLPRPGLPKFAVKPLIESPIHYEFASNPCRIIFEGKELLFMREEFLVKFHRNRIQMPPSAGVIEDDTKGLCQNVIKTVIDQSHLSPFHLSNSPVLWAYDHSLSLYPLPDVLLMADSSRSFEWDYMDVITANPGSFEKESAFIVYSAKSNSLQFQTV